MKRQPYFRRLLLFATCLPLIFLYSCSAEDDFLKSGGCPEPDSELQEQINAAGITFPQIHDGRLYFESHQDFGSFMNKFVKIDMDYVVEYTRSNCFTSLQDVYEGMTEEEEVLVTVNNSENVEVCDPYFASVLNVEKEIEIGQNVIYRVTNRYVIAYIKGHQNEVDSIIIKQPSMGSEQSGQFSKHAYVFERDSTSYSKIAFGRSNKWSPNASFFYFGNDYRFRCNQWQENWFFYKSNGCKTEMQRYSGWWIFKSWKLEKTHFIKTTWTNVNFVLGGAYVANANGSIAGYNKSRVGKVFFEAVGGGVSYNFSSGVFSPVAVVDVPELFGYVKTDHEVQRAATSGYIHKTYTMNIDWSF